mmetsp:Transcript_14007/g.18168  ORF Transcript_14007/g.18168 Transcript_14007/m.18168 type:complete len:151 (+) Transcript_14007:113-565(+)
MAVCGFYITVDFENDFPKVVLAYSLVLIVGGFILWVLALQNSIAPPASFDSGLIIWLFAIGTGGLGIQYYRTGSEKIRKWHRYSSMGSHAIISLVLFIALFLDTFSVAFLLIMLIAWAASGVYIEYIHRKYDKFLLEKGGTNNGAANPSI